MSDMVLRSEGRLAVASGRARKVRLAARLSQREFASALDVTAAAVSRWEAGNRVPRGESAERLGELLRELERAAIPGKVLVP